VAKFFLLLFLLLGLHNCASEGPNVPNEGEDPSLMDEDSFMKPASGLSESKTFEVKEKAQAAIQKIEQGKQNLSENGFPLVVRIDKTTQVFARPSAKSRILADVSRGTTLIARKTTPQGYWLLVEDEDANKGWVPQMRTNYLALKNKMSEKNSAFENKNTNSAMELIEDLGPEKGQIVEQEIYDPEDTKPTNDSPVLGMATFHIEKSGYGVHFGYLSPMATDGKNPDRLRRLGFDVGITQGWTAGTADQANTTVSLKMRMLSQVEGQNFGTGPDLGAIYQLQSRLWGPSLGYSLGFVPAWGSGFLLLMKAGLEWPAWKTQVTLGIETGWAF